MATGRMNRGDRFETIDKFYHCGIIEELLQSNKKLQQMMEEALRRVPLQETENDVENLNTKYVSNIEELLGDYFDDNTLDQIEPAWDDYEQGGSCESTEKIETMDDFHSIDELQTLVFRDDTTSISTVINLDQPPIFDEEEFEEQHASNSIFTDFLFESYAHCNTKISTTYLWLQKLMNYAYVSLYWCDWMDINRRAGKFTVRHPLHFQIKLHKNICGNFLQGRMMQSRVNYLLFARLIKLRKMNYEKLDSVLCKKNTRPLNSRTSSFREGENDAVN